MRADRVCTRSISTLAIFTLSLLMTATAAGQEKVLHNFDSNGRDGLFPTASLIFDSVGNVYGTTSQGGAYTEGTVFELIRAASGSWTEKVLHSFNDNGEDGYGPSAGLIFGPSGNLYGTTYSGGAYGYGTVFELSPDPDGSWTEKVLHNFMNNGAEGISPFAALIFDVKGNLYGTTAQGGSGNGGTVFELAPTAGGSWTETVLFSFSDNSGTGGYSPVAGLIFDASGNLYSTTLRGGAYGYGTVFELIPTAGGSWTEKVLHDFNGGGNDGNSPYAGLIFDPLGNLYGTTAEGGDHGYGTVFVLVPTRRKGWAEKVLHNFDDNGSDGADPNAGVIFDASGNLYGTTAIGGTHDNGTVFELLPTAGGTWTEQVLHRFDGTDGQNPNSAVIFDPGGNLYGTTLNGGTHNVGTVFETRP
jgi:uncharacterized repeat protein (TIGR03803 family)